MIIYNWIAKIIVQIADRLNKNYRIRGVTIWPFIFIEKYEPKEFNDAGMRRLRKHERCHLKQWEQYWIIGFLPVYIYQCVKYGYWNAPLEVLARKAEDE